MIYLINAQDTNLYKIGYTENLENRIKSLQTGCPHKLKTIKSVVGTLRQEKELHRFWNHTRKSGEWFEFNDFMVRRTKDIMEEFETEHKEINKWNNRYNEEITEIRDHWEKKVRG